MSIYNNSDSEESEVFSYIPITMPDEFESSSDDDSSNCIKEMENDEHNENERNVVSPHPPPITLTQRTSDAAASLLNLFCTANKSSARDGGGIPTVTTTASKSSARDGGGILD